ncbi:MAG TPA: MFS transporter [Nitrososphaeraceae archaeon]|jgi:EmrB/QacA subfamily drug resistance transporter|nr:MFS transporter [Nitrososphaeraceae archaeon]
MNYKWITLSNTTIGTLMASLDRNIVLIALPTIALDLHTSFFTLVWIVLVYWLVTASVLLNFGRLSDMFGRVKLYNMGFALFTLGSGLCSISQTGEQLILFRIIQALGAAFLFSNSAAIITDTFAENERAKALGLNQTSIVVGSVIGLVLGGFLTSYLGWRSIFWVNLPIGIFATIWSYAKLRELGVIRKEKIDWLGNTTFAGGLSMILLGITLATFKIINPYEIFLSIIGGLALLVLFIIIEKKVSRPMFDLSLFKIRLFTGGNIAIFLNALARGAFTLIMSFYLQGPSMKLNSLDAGIYLIPVSIALAVFAPVSGWLYDKYKLRFFTSTGLLVSALGFFILTRIGITTSFYEVVMPLVMIGGGMGIFASPNRASIMTSVPSSRRGVSAGISTTFVMVGNSFSIGLVFLIMTNIIPLHTVEQLFSGSFQPSSSVPISNPIVNKFISSIHFVFFVSAIMMLASIIPSVIRWNGTAH